MSEIIDGVSYPSMDEKEKEYTARYYFCDLLGATIDLEDLIIASKDLRMLVTNGRGDGTTVVVGVALHYSTKPDRVLLEVDGDGISAVAAVGYISEALNSYVEGKKRWAEQEKELEEQGRLADTLLKEQD